MKPHAMLPDKSLYRQGQKTVVFHWISILWSVNGTSMCHYSACAGTTGCLRFQRISIITRIADAAHNIISKLNAGR